MLGACLPFGGAAASVGSAPAAATEAPAIKPRRVKSFNGGSFGRAPRQIYRRFVGRAKERSDVPAASHNGGHASLCPPYGLIAGTRRFQDRRPARDLGLHIGV